MTARRRGRPPRASGPAFDHDAVEQLLQHGELVPQAVGPPLRVFPGVCELARRYAVSPSAISRLAKRRGLTLQPRPPLAGSTAQGSRPSPRTRGRPPKGTPAIPWDEIDHLLVEGETSRLPSGAVVIVYPNQQEIADRYRVHLSSIYRYWMKHRGHERRDEHRRLLCETAPVRLTTEQQTSVVTGDGVVMGDADDDLIVARRIVARNYRLAAEAGEVRANDPIVVREADRLGRDAHDRKYGGETETSFLQALATARDRALAGRRRFEELPLAATGRIIEVTAEEVVLPPRSRAPDVASE